MLQPYYSSIVFCHNSQLIRYNAFVRTKLRKYLYKNLLGFLDLSVDYKGDSRSELGVSPYARRSPLLMTLFNLRELTIFVKDRSSTKFFKAQTRALRNTQIRSRALVLGNGPSLAKLNSHKVSLDGPDIWVVNDFYKVRQAADLKVSHYVLSDPAYFSGLPLEINARLKPVLDYVKIKEATLILPHWAKDLFYKQTTSGKVYYFDDRSLAAWSKNTTPVKPRGYIGLTLYKALGFALYLGYERIYILGMDNSEFLNYRSDPDNRLLHYNSHAYQNPDLAYDMSNHYLDGMASALTSLSHNFGDLVKFKGSIANLDGQSLTTRFPKEADHPWVS